MQSGEGVFGLRRAFQLAGARTLVASLAPVEDATTERRMLEFYRAWLERDESVASAVRSAALSLLREQRDRRESTHPYHWSGFVSVGGRAPCARDIEDHRPIEAVGSEPERRGERDGR